MNFFGYLLKFDLVCEQSVSIIINYVQVRTSTDTRNGLYWLFFKTKLVPNWLALWGLIGAVLYFVAPIANMFDAQHLPLSLGVKWGYLMIPLAIQEMVFALWLIVKGFNPSAELALTSANT